MNAQVFIPYHKKRVHLTSAYLVKSMEHIWFFLSAVCNSLVSRKARFSFLISRDFRHLAPFNLKTTQVFDNHANSEYINYRILQV